MTQKIAQNLAYIKKKQYLCSRKGFQIPFPPVADGVINTVTYRRPSPEGVRGEIKINTNENVY
jgi:hypothetical protein